MTSNTTPKLTPAMSAAMTGAFATRLGGFHIPTFRVRANTADGLIRRGLVTRMTYAHDQGFGSYELTGAGVQWLGEYADSVPAAFTTTTDGRSSVFIPGHGTFTASKADVMATRNATHNTPIEAMQDHMAAIAERSYRNVGSREALIVAMADCGYALTVAPADITKGVRNPATCGQCGRSMPADAHQCAGCDELDRVNREAAAADEAAASDPTYVGHGCDACAAALANDDTSGMDEADASALAAFSERHGYVVVDGEDTEPFGNGGGYWSCAVCSWEQIGTGHALNTIGGDDDATDEGGQDDAPADEAPVTPVAVSEAFQGRLNALVAPAAASVDTSGQDDGPLSGWVVVDHSHTPVAVVASGAGANTVTATTAAGLSGRTDVFAVLPSTNVRAAASLAGLPVLVFPAEAIAAAEAAPVVIVTRRAGANGYPWRAVCGRCGWVSRGYAAGHAAADVAEAHACDDGWTVANPAYPVPGPVTPVAAPVADQPAPVAPEPVAPIVDPIGSAPWVAVLAKLTDLAATGESNNTREAAAVVAAMNNTGRPVGTMKAWFADRVGQRVHTVQWVKADGSGLWAPTYRTVDSMRAGAVVLAGSTRDFRGMRVYSATSTALVVADTWHAVVYVVATNPVDDEAPADEAVTAPRGPVAAPAVGWQTQPQQQHQAAMTADEAPAAVDDEAPAVWTLNIPEWRMDELTKRVDQANARLARAGASDDARFTFTAEPFTKAVYVGGMILPDGTRFGGSTVAEPWMEVTMNTFTLALGDYVFVASLVAEENGTVTHCAPGQSLGGWARTDGGCDHCDTNRRRTRLYVVREVATGRLLQLGHGCISLYTGMAPVGLWALGFTDELTEAFSDDGERSYNSLPVAFPVADVLLFSWVHADEGRRYVSRAAAYDGRRATADLVWTSLVANIARMTPEADREYFRGVAMKVHELREDTAACAALVADLLAAADELDPTSDYGANMRVIAAGENVNRRNLGILASLVSAYARQKSIAAERAARAAAPGAASGFLAPVKGKLTDLSLTLTVVKFMDGYTYDSTSTFLVGTTASGHVVKWTASREISVSVGDVLAIKSATVKAHETYRGTDQTVITRARLADK